VQAKEIYYINQTDSLDSPVNERLALRKILSRNSKKMSITMPNEPVELIEIFDLCCASFSQESARRIYSIQCSTNFSFQLFPTSSYALGRCSTMALQQFSEENQMSNN
jgi:hypothetical protein